MRAWRSAALAWTVLLTAAAAATAQSAPPSSATGEPCPTPTQDTGFEEVKVNVAAGIVDRVLPFDVPVRLCGVAPAGTRGARVRIAESRDPVETTGRICIEQTGIWAGSVDIPAQIDPTTNAFRAVVQRFDAQRFYSFCFLFEREIPDSLKTQLAGPLRAAIDAEVAQISSGDVTAADTAAVREAMRKSILEATGGEALIAAGSLFDPSVPIEDVKADFVDELADILGPQLNARNAVQGRAASAGAPATRSFAARQFDLATALRKIAADPALDRLVTALRQAGAADPNLAMLVSSDYASALALADQGDAGAGLLARGLDAASAGGEDLSTSTDPLVASATASRYGALSTTIAGDGSPDAGLIGMIDRFLRADAPPAVGSALADTDRTGLGALRDGAATAASDLAFELQGLAANVAVALQKRSAELDDLAQKVELALTDVSIADSSTSGNFETAQNFYISADAGLLAAAELDEVLPYVGTNIYFRPVNKNASLRTLGSFGQTFSRRFALSIGLTAASVAETEDGATVREDLFGTQSLVFGAGLRLTDMIRLGAGAIVFKEDDPSPLVENLSVAVSYYVSISFDLNVARAFQGGLGGLFQ